MSHYSKQQQDALTLCEDWFEELNLDTSLFESNKKNRNNLIDNLRKHKDWKWEEVRVIRKPPRHCDDKVRNYQIL